MSSLHSHSPTSDLSATSAHSIADEPPQASACRIVVLISGSGSNMQAIVRAAKQPTWQERYNAQVVGVISNRAGAKGLAWAQGEGIPTTVVAHQDHAKRPDFDLALQNAVDKFQPDLVVLAGFMRILGADFVNHYTGRLLNIHPSLLPAFTGLHTHERAIEAGCQFAGATVHQVTAELDAGAILAQAVVPVLPTDTAESLAARVLTQEHRIYPAVIARWVEHWRLQRTPQAHTPNHT